MSTAIKERPILFSAPMVRAILDGRKTQTRRVVKPQPLHDGFEVCRYHKACVDRDGTLYPSCEMYFGISDADGEWATKCPYGQPGDRLWVRESFCTDIRDPLNCVIYKATPEFGKYRNTGEIVRSTFPDGSLPNREESEKAMLPKFWKCKPSIHMPRWASRITLEVTDVRVERLQDISEDDVEAEGMDEAPNPDYDEEDPCDDEPYTFLAGFIDYLKNHGHMDWDANPWVWVVQFEVVK